MNMYEVLDELENSLDIKATLLKYNSPNLRHFFTLVFDENVKFYVNEFPPEYRTPDTLPGISESNIPQELRRLYLFQKGESIADKLTNQKRNQLLCQLLESFEPREAQTLINLFNKDLKSKKITKKIVKETLNLNI